MSAQKSINMIVSLVTNCCLTQRYATSIYSMTSCDIQCSVAIYLIVSLYQRDASGRYSVNYNKTSSIRHIYIIAMLLVILKKLELFNSNFVHIHFVSIEFMKCSRFKMFHRIC